MGARKRALSVNTEKNDPAVVDDGELTAEEGPPLSPAGRLFHQPHFNCYIIGMMGLGKTADVDVIKAGLEATMVRHPRFSSILVPDDPKTQKSRWVRTNVVIDNHVVVPNLIPPETTTTLSSDQLVEDYVASLSTTHLPLSRPLWDFHIINLRTSRAESVVILRIHHSLGDGISLMSLFLACTRKTSDPDSVPSLPQAQSSRKVRDSINRSRVLGLLLWVWALLVIAWNTIVDVMIFMATSIFLSDSETPLKGVKAVEFRRKRFVHRAVNLDDIKVVKNSFGCTINDVLVGVTSAGLSRYLNRRYGEKSNGEMKEKSLPSNLRLRSTALVNIRPSPGIHALAEMMEGGKATRWGNSIGYIILKFPIGLCNDPLDYVRKGMKIMKRKKNTLEAIFTYTSGVIIVKLFGIKAAAALCYRMLLNTTVSFSNVVGPIEEVGFHGHPIVFIAPSVYGHPQAVTFHFQSYMNKMEMVLAVDEVAVPDPHQLLDDLAVSLNLIKDAVVSK